MTTKHHNDDAQAAATQVDTMERTLAVIGQGCDVMADKAKCHGNDREAALWAHACYEVYAAKLRLQAAKRSLERMATVAAV